MNNLSADTTIEEKEMKVRLFDKVRKHHALMMIFCCMFPILAVLSLSYLGVLGSWGYYALFLICPLSHILMFRKSHADQDKEKKLAIKVIPQDTRNQEYKGSSN